MKLYADIVLPLAVQPFTFEVDEALYGTIACGMAVEVPLGERKIYAGIIWRLHDKAPSRGKIKTIRRTIRPETIVSPEQMALWEWTADYYMCSLGEVMRAALPAALKPSAFDEVEFGRSLFALPKERFVRLASGVASEESLNNLFESLGKRAKGQHKALLDFCNLAGGTAEKIFGSEVAVGNIEASAAVMKTLVEKGVFEVVEHERKQGRDNRYKEHLAVLSEAQAEAVGQIETAFQSRSTVLLHGVTSSGKTEIYMHLIAKELAQGHSVLYLLPEIAVTKQLIDRITAAFGSNVIPYHSKYTVRNRTESYLRLAGAVGGELIVGVRSALFLPLPRLGLIIVDEEHDRSFKQESSPPRYSARDAAVWLAHNSGAKTLLGSATPSLESYANALSGRYGYVFLGERYGDGRPPAVELSDTLRSAKRGERRGHFNKELRDAVAEALAAKRQVMLFQNRRGFAPYIECGDCGWTPHCPHCGVSLTLYKAENRLRCNLCGYSTRLPERCPSCKVATPEPQGFGTEKIEETAAELFPTARIARLDGDTATSPRRYGQIIDDFEAGQTDILVGTQMITKGFDFEGVSVVGVMNADNLLNYPDFRASERAFQTLVQFAGRAGRNDSLGRVVIQTAQPLDNTLSEVVRGDYRSMAEEQLRERERFGYPPFVRLITLSLRQRSRDLLFHGADMLVGRLRKRLGRDAVSDAHQPVVGKIADINIVEILLRIERTASVREFKSALSEELKLFAKEPLCRRIEIAIDVDPQ